MKTVEASLDRVDSSIGYLKGNVRFISWTANITKNAEPDSELIEFCNLVIQHQNKLKEDKQK